MTPVVCYSESFPLAIAAQGKGKNVLIFKALLFPIRREDGKGAAFSLEHRMLSVPCNKESDQAWACVTDSEFTYWTRGEVGALLREIKKTPQKLNLFDFFNLY